MFQVKADQSFTKLVYACVFDSDVGGNQMRRLAGGFAAAEWKHGRSEKSYRIWKRARLDTIGLLPHVRDYLSAETDQPTLIAFELEGEAQQALWGGQGKTRWALQSKSEHQAIGFNPESVQLFIARSGIVFMVITVRPAPSCTPSDFLNLNYRLRYPQRSGNTITCELKDREGLFSVGWTDEVRRLTSSPDRMLSIVDGLLNSGGAEAGTFRPSIDGERFTCFTSLALRSKEPADHTTSIDRWPEALELHWRKLRTFSPDARDDLGAFDDGFLDARATVAEGNQRFGFSLEGGAYLVHDPRPDFQSTTFPEMLAGGYFIQFLLAYHQRAALAELSRLIAEQFVPPDGDQALFRRNARDLHQRVFNFTWRSLFTQISDNYRRQAYYSRWLEVLEISHLYREVRERVRDVNEANAAQQSVRHLTRMGESLKHQLAAATTMHIVEVAIAGVYVLEGSNLLLEYSGAKEYIAEHGPRFLGLPSLFFVALTLIIGTLVGLPRYLRYREKRYLRELEHEGLEEG